MTTDRAADTAAATTGVLLGLSLSSVNLIVQIVAGLVAIAVGAMTFIYYWNKWRSGKMHMRWDQEDREARRGEDK